jgi:hypothetical protein
LSFYGKRSMTWLMMAAALAAFGVLGRLLTRSFRVTWEIDNRPKRRSKRDVYKIDAPWEDGEINIPPRRRYER